MMCNCKNEFDEKSGGVCNVSVLYQCNEPHGLCTKMSSILEMVLEFLCVGSRFGSLPSRF